MEDADWLGKEVSDFRNSLGFEGGVTYEMMFYDGIWQRQFGVG